MSIVGRCMMMCPVKEFRFRKKHGLMQSLEDPSVLFGLQKEINMEYFVKEFRRSSAGEEMCNPDEIRPGHVLLKTIDHLFSQVFFSTVSFTILYDFIFDRLRSIRQDVVIQQLDQIEPITCIKILERCVRFYLYSAHRILQNPKLHIDSHINHTHTQECLKKLWGVYSSNVEIIEESSDNFLATSTSYLLLNMERSDVIYEILKLPKTLRDLEPLTLVIEMFFANNSDNFIRVFKLVKNLMQSDNYIGLFAMATIINNIRANAVKMLSHSHNSKMCKFPAEDLKDWLMLKKDDDLVDFCKKFNLLIVDFKFIKFLKCDYLDKSSSDRVHSCYLTDALNDLSTECISSYLRS